jgi:hypothetical protein
MSDEAELLQLAKAIQERIVEAVRALESGSWCPTMEGMAELSSLVDHFTMGAQLLHLKQHGNPVQDGRIVSES